jgi:S1-C subfamily serine protease
MEAPYSLLGGGPESGLALLRIESATTGQAFVPADPASLHPGLLVAAVSLTADGRLLIAPGYLASAPHAAGEDGALVDEDSLDVAIAFPSSLPAAAIVDLDGNLVGAAFDAGGRRRLLSSEALVRVVERLGSHPFCHAIEVTTIDERTKKLLGVTAGVLVQRVRETAFVPGPSVREGDVLLEWGGHEIASPEDFRSFYEGGSPGTLVPFVVRRGRRPLRGRTVMPAPDCSPAGTAPVALSRIGMTLGGRDDSDGWEVLTLTSGGPAARGGIQVGDRVLRVDGLDFGHDGLEVLEGFERRPAPLPLLIRRDRRVHLLTVSPDGE